MRKTLFLLGGCDLEMEEIRKLLKNQGCKPYEKEAEGACFYADRNLEWGAKLSDYGDLLDFDGEIVGIELVDDIEPPSNYRVIDHHGKLWCRPSALEQVADMFGVQLNRWQQLVSANDKGHIPALEAMGATPEEIAKIREADMKAQGVTEGEIEQAILDAKTARLEKGVWIVETRLKHVSPLVDLLFYQKKLPAIVIDPDEPTLSFYGGTITKLIGRFKEAVDKGTAYYGGNPLGYFGLTKEYFKEHTPKEAIDAIIEAHKERTMYSYHIFMLPFVTNENALNPNERWREIPFAIEGKEAALRYNETTYFHPFVRPVLFNNKKGAGISRYFEYENQKGEYIIEVQNQTYRLELDGIALRHFENGVGILSFHLINHRYDGFEDILRINDFGRRLFPQFLGDGLVESTIDRLLACSLTLALEGEKPIRESFDHYRDIEKISNQPHRFPLFIEKLLGDAYEKNDCIPLIDDRMYLMCHYMNDCIADELTTYNEKNGQYAYETSQEWHRYIFVDGGDSTCQNRHMLQTLLQKATYARWSGYGTLFGVTRWSDYGTLFGVTRYSFMLLSKNDDFARNVLNRHIRTVYFQMATLLLAYRAMILVFSNQVTSALEGKNDKSRKEKSETLFRKYIEFQNRIYFREVTAQEQGIELFDMARKQMRLDTHLQELDHDIAELHDFIQLKVEDRRNEQGLLLNKIAAIFLPAGLVSGILGMNFFPESWEHNFWWIFAGFAVSAAGTWAIFTKIRSTYNE